jgi:hypothetical protein
MLGWDMLAWIGAAISWWGTISYMVAIVRGGTQPRLASWIAWAAANSILTAIAFMHEAHTAAIFNGLAALGNISVLAVSAVKRAGDKPQGMTDWSCLGATGICFAAILSFSHLTYLVAILAMCANVIATWPTIQHAWRRPQEEAWQLFAANGGASALGLVSVFAAAGASLGNIAGPLISMVGNVSLVVITVGRSWLTSTVSSVEEAVEDIMEEAMEDVQVVQNVLAKPQATVAKRDKRGLIRTY